MGTPQALAARAVTPQREPGAQPGWLRWLFGDVALGQGVQRAIVWGALALVMALAAAIIVERVARRGPPAPAQAARRSRGLGHRIMAPSGE